MDVLKEKQFVHKTVVLVKGIRTCQVIKKRGNIPVYAFELGAHPLKHSSSHNSTESFFLLFN